MLPEHKNVFEQSLIGYVNFIGYLEARCNNRFIPGPKATRDSPRVEYSVLLIQWLADLTCTEQFSYPT